MIKLLCYFCHFFNVIILWNCTNQTRMAEHRITGSDLCKILVSDSLFDKKMIICGTKPIFITPMDYNLHLCIISLAILFNFLIQEYFSNTINKNDLLFIIDLFIDWPSHIMNKASNLFNLRRLEIRSWTFCYFCLLFFTIYRNCIIFMMIA